LSAVRQRKAEIYKPFQGVYQNKRRVIPLSITKESLI